VLVSRRKAFFDDNVSTDDVTSFTENHVKGIHYGRDTFPRGKVEFGRQNHG
jgi:hypothetical protein